MIGHGELKWKKDEEAQSVVIRRKWLDNEGLAMVMVASFAYLAATVTGFMREMW